MGKIAMLARGGKEPPYNPARVQLAQALDEIGRLERSVAEKSATVSRAHEMIAEAIREQDEAEQGVESARVTLRTRMIDSARTGSPALRDDVMGMAHARLATANEALAAAQAAVEVVRSSHEEHEEALVSAQRRRNAAIAKIFDDEVDGILAETIELRDKFLGKLIELRFVSSLAGNAWPPTDRSKAIDRLMNMPFGSTLHEAVRTDTAAAQPVVRPWRDAIQALQSDANAQLPTRAK
ncbi:hypothetical protein FP026_29635 [Rhizobium tropici]|uniref:Uncharacterized protein n=1 Tax=Rhizobium tropici TaxID=398 RepID=A0A5B0VIT9_RHITR|nr:hypothetical protein [Rhizobium tropici]KAA1174650.1 hypothetical protein FP026_29635 [Rhizobium tropici]